jgi:hypothetical protein
MRQYSNAIRVIVLKLKKGFLNGAKNASIAMRN